MEMESNRVFNQAAERDQLSPELLADFLKLHNRRNQKKMCQTMESYQSQYINSNNQYPSEIHRTKEYVNQPLYHQNVVYQSSSTQKLPSWPSVQNIQQYPGQESFVPIVPFVPFPSEPLRQIWQPQAIPAPPTVQPSITSEKNNSMSFVPDHFQQFYTNLLSNESFHVQQPDTTNLEYNSFQQQRQHIPSPPPLSMVPNYSKMLEPTDEQLKEFEEILLHYCRADASLPPLQKNKPYSHNFHQHENYPQRKMTTSSPIKKSKYFDISNYQDMNNNYTVEPETHNMPHKTQNTLQSYKPSFQLKPLFDLNQEQPSKGAIPKRKPTKEITDRSYSPFEKEQQMAMEDQLKMSTVYRQTNDYPNNNDNVEMPFFQHTDRFSDNPDSANYSVNEESLYCPPSESPQDTRKFRYGRPRDAIALYYRLCKDVCKLRAEYTQNKLEEDSNDSPLYKSNKNNNKANGHDLNHDKNKGGHTKGGVRPNKYKFIHRVVEVELEFDRLIYSATLDMMTKLNQEISEFEKRLNIPKTRKNISF